MSEKESHAVSGFVKPGFESVQEAFVENFTRRHELGAACCIYHRGEKLGLDFYIRLPEEIPNSKLATIQRSSPGLGFFRGNPRFALAFMNPLSLTFQAFWKNPGMAIPFDAERVYARNIEVPSIGGVGTARAIAKAYCVFASGGREVGLREETLQKLMAPAVPPRRGFYDECLKIEWTLSLGFLKPCPAYPIGSPGAFGTPGSGGSFGFGDPQGRIGYAYVTNLLGAKQGTDPRELALRNAFHRAINQPIASMSAQEDSM